MKKSFECDVLVIGGGVAGLSTAYHLAQGPGKLRVIVVEREKQLGGHASGRNAGMIRQALPDPMLVRLAREGREALERALSLRAWKGLGLRTVGSLLLDDRRDAVELRRTSEALSGESVSSERLSERAVRAKVPAFGAGTFSDALFCPSDAVLDIRALVRGFERELSARGVKILFGAPIRSVRKSGVLFEVAAPPYEFRAQVLVNAAGAWASEVAALAGASAVPLAAYRRHLYETASLPEVPKTAPFVWHVSREFYFRPLPRGFLVSPCDKTPVDPPRFVAEPADPVVRTGKSFAGESVDPDMAKNLIAKLSAVSPKFSRVRLGRARSGLRTMTPDGRFVIGLDPKLFGFFWVAGLGGHGVTTCFSVGRMAADLISGRRVDPQLEKAFAPGRFN